MGDYNFGSEAFWKFILAMAAIGTIAGIIWVIKLIIWLFNHVHIS